ncbi:hypothetical protein K2173_008553 [Erythroxylum novogranatense]|uniref:Pentatricopeptide repeat-containing protein n=1 Tax=Erythroxylum novogranatense TaxID=1862640 RepID=A0AAV8SKU4_9ROSI|nr:hypothetical protein K2173_008553 [Erythroxylum novogranatense]
MFMRSCPMKWKNNRYNNFKNYSTCNPIASSDCPHVVSTNIAIREHACQGELYIARYLFDRMPQRTVVSWNTMISGYAHWGKFEESLSLFTMMHGSGTRLSGATFSTVLSICARALSFCSGKLIHCLVLKSGCESFERVGGALLYFYAKCWQIHYARRVFEELRGGNDVLYYLMIVGYVQCGLLADAYDLFVKMPTRDVMAWTALISGYAKSDNSCEMALDLFRCMRGSGEAVPNEFTLDSVIRVCSRLGALSKGFNIHGIVVKCGYEFDLSICGALIELYCSCQAVDDAKMVYDRITGPCSNTSNSMISGLILMGRIEDAECVFQRMKKNAVSYNLMVKGYAINGQFEDSKKLFEKMPHKTIISSNTMISVFSRNGEINKAMMLFEDTKQEKNPVTWNSMMSGYIQNDRHEEALKLFLSMRQLSVEWTRSTFSVLFHACSSLGSLQQGQMLHSNLIKTPFESDVYVVTSLVDMYSKCGNIIDAQKSFSSISTANVAAWTALINGYAHHGFGSEAILLFQCMLEQGVAPNGATFVGILSACGRAGLVNEGMIFFYSMKELYGITPTLEHYACVVDLLGRSGHLLEAEEFIKSMPIEADGVIWAALLSACWLWRDMEVGERVANYLFNLDPKVTSAYVIMSNMYAFLGKWGEKINVRNRLRALKLKKHPGCSWIELNDRLHVFSAENRTHPLSNVICTTLGHLTENLLSHTIVNTSIQQCNLYYLGASD